MIKLLFCGDFVSQSPEKIKLGAKLKALIDCQDYAAVNFEAPLRGFGNDIRKSGPALTQACESVDFLLDNGFNIILLANNHMMDKGRTACEHTREAFRKRDVHVVGAGDFSDAFDVPVLEKDNLRVGLLNLTHKEFGTLGIDSGPGDYGTAWISHPIVNQQIIKAKEICDYLIVLPHAGIEDVLVPLPEWRARYKEFIDLGADLVIGSHPHTPQGWEEYKGKSIYYSLGNFFFELFSPSYGPNWFKSLIVECTVDKKDGIRTKVYNCKFDKANIDIDESKEAAEYVEYLCSLLNDSKCYKSYLDAELKKLWPIYKLYMLRGLPAVTPTLNIHLLSHSAYGLLKGADIPLLINNFQCESHRWAIERMLNLQLNEK